MTLVATVPLVLLLAACGWVYRDAKANQDAGSPVVLQAGSLRIDTAEGWSIGCLVLCFVFLPIYLAARNTTFTGSS